MGCLGLVDQHGGRWTVVPMDDREVRGRILPTPFYTSFIGKARMGSLEDPDMGKRVGAWATWAVENLTEIIGVSERSYAAINLEGRAGGAWTKARLPFIGEPEDCP